MKSKIAAAVLLFALLPAAVFAREIVDMAGRHVNVPEKITKLYVPSPFGAYAMYALAPDLMTGLVMRPGQEKYLPPSLHGLPVLGVMLTGMGMSADPEAILKSGPQVLVLWELARSPMDEKVHDALEHMGIPYVIVYGNDMAEYPAAFRFLGKLTGRTERAEQLARNMEKILADVKAGVEKIPAGKRPKVYYAEGPDGLSTECDDSFHTQLLKVLGDLDVHRCHTSGHMGMEKISLEQIILYQPDAIVAQTKSFYDTVLTNPAWQQVKAVQDKRVYLVPRTPLNWFDRPPSIMRFIGVQWLANQLYPQQFPLDGTKAIKDFYQLYLGVSLDDQDVRSILTQQ